MPIALFLLGHFEYRFDLLVNVNRYIAKVFILEVDIGVFLFAATAIILGSQMHIMCIFAMLQQLDVAMEAQVTLGLLTFI